MKDKISIIYANRNKDIQRIKSTLHSLEGQEAQNFEVVIVDYGSDSDLVHNLQELVSGYGFVRLFSLEVSQLLWNKSKALNYGIKKAIGSYIFIADVDLIFHPKTTIFFEEKLNSEYFFLFKMGYLTRTESHKLTEDYDFEMLSAKRFGRVNGMILAPKGALEKVNGLDEFFHFYGAEDEDLFARLENAGYLRKEISEPLFLHNWHQSFSGSEDKILTGNPRVKNIMRINQRHFIQNRENGVIKPPRQEGMGSIISKEGGELLKKPTRRYKILNILAHVEHFLNEELAGLKGEIVEAEFKEDPYYHSIKHSLKKFFGKQTQPYCSLKEVNDILLKRIVFNYRNSNYSFTIADDKKSIIFCVQV